VSMNPNLNRPIRPRMPLALLLPRLGDILLLPLVLVLAALVSGRTLAGEPYLLAALAAMLLFAFFSMVLRLYPADQTVAPTFGKLLQAWALTIFVLLLLSFAGKTTEIYSRLVIGLWFVAVPVALLLWRRFCLWLLTALGRQESSQRQVAIAGAGDLGAHLGRLLGDDNFGGGHLVAYYDDAKTVGYCPLEKSDIAVAGTLDDLCRKALAGKIDRVYLALPLRAEKRMVEVARRLGDACVEVHLVPDLFVFNLVQPRWFSFHGLPMVSIHDTPHTGLDSWLKQTSDYLLTLLLLLLFSPLLPVITLGVKLSSPGPIIFTQRRYGLDGREIVIWKFRTMTVCEDDLKHCDQARPHDPRLTRFGALLRRYSLDELPQLINVLQGRMALIGPRPHAVAHNEQYRRLIPDYMLRHKVKPGITGWALGPGQRPARSYRYSGEDGKTVALRPLLHLELVTLAGPEDRRPHRLHGIPREKRLLSHLANLVFRVIGGQVTLLPEAGT